MAPSFGDKLKGAEPFLQYVIGSSDKREGLESLVPDDDFIVFVIICFGGIFEFDFCPVFRKDIENAAESQSVRNVIVDDELILARRRFLIEGVAAGI